MQWCKRHNGNSQNFQLSTNVYRNFTFIETNQLTSFVSELNSKIDLKIKYFKPNYEFILELKWEILI